jgi:hypothetical protein
LTVAPGALTYAPPYYIASIGNGGFVFAFSDQGGSTACVSGAGFCGSATTGLASATVWGAGIGVDLNQMPTSITPGIYAAPMASSGVTYALSSAPTGTVYLVIDNAGTAYYATITAASGSVPWAMFGTTPWATATNKPLAGPPQMATRLQIQLSAGTAASSFNFCVTALKII